jgi:hypothetical protein
LLGRKEEDLNLYIVLAVINLALWIVGMICHVGPAVHLFPVVAFGLSATDLYERRKVRRHAQTAPQMSAMAADALGRSTIRQPLIAVGSTMRKQTFLAGISVEQQSARLVRQAKFQQCCTRSELLGSKLNSTAELAV